MAERLGDILLRKKLITEDKLEAALREQGHSGRFLGEILMSLGFVGEEDLLTVLAEQFNTRFVKLDNVRINPMIAKMVPRDIVWEHKFMPLEMRNAVILIAVSNPLDMWPMSILQDKLDLSDVQVVLARKEDILTQIKKYFGSEMGGQA